jgi:hypothetical protein
MQDEAALGGGRDDAFAVCHRCPVSASIENSERRWVRVGRSVAGGPSMQRLSPNDLGGCSDSEKGGVEASAVARLGGGALALQQLAELVGRQ